MRKETMFIRRFPMFSAMRYRAGKHLLQTPFVMPITRTKTRTQNRDDFATIPLAL